MEVSKDWGPVSGIYIDTHIHTHIYIYIRIYIYTFEGSHYFESIVGALILETPNCLKKLCSPLHA